MSLGTLTIVATPIGNLQDMTPHAIDVLQKVDVVLCEDTRVTKPLLTHFGITTATMSYHHHSTGAKVQEIRMLLEAGKHLALVSDAGTPGISDPGNKLIAELRVSLPQLIVSTAPGVCAVTAALSISGFATDTFLFLGFPPHKQKRKKFFEEVAKSPYTVCFYESCHRIQKAISALAEVLPPDRQVCICREITKKFETVYRGTMSEIQSHPMVAKGEFVIIVENM